MARTESVVVGIVRDDPALWEMLFLDAAGEAITSERVADQELAARIGAIEAEHAPRWVWSSAHDRYPRLLAAGARVARAHDLVLCHAILRDTALIDPSLTPDPAWEAHAPAETDAAPATLFELERTPSESRDESVQAAHAQYRAQREAMARDADGRLALLAAAESAGALVAEEMRAAGVPWDGAEHGRILDATLGARPPGGGMPTRMAHYAEKVREALGDPALSIDSPPKLLRALHRAGMLVESTSRWELAEQRHPAIEPLLAYKKLSRLHVANGWAWLAEWVDEGRFRPVYVPGGVVTGRWASSGGGALQLPRSLRPAVRADEGWRLIVADVAQLEPRMLAAMSRDSAMARAAQGADLYEGIVASGAVATREEAKYAVLGAMYGATTGDAGRLVPRLRKVFPRAMGLVDDAAQRGEQGGLVSTWLGRTCPPPSPRWHEIQGAASGPDAGAGEESRARRAAKDRGRFTRNFVVQGTAAEWALIWLAEIRHRLWQLPPARHPAPASGPLFSERAHLAFFLHDEVIVHAPEECADAAAEAVREAAAVATARMFGDFPVDVPLDLRIGLSAQK